MPVEVAVLAEYMSCLVAHHHHLSVTTSRFSRQVPLSGEVLTY